MDRIGKALEQARKNVAKVRPKPQSESSVPRQYANKRKVSLSSRILRENRIFTQNDDEQIVDIYGLLRTRVLKSMRKNNWKMLGVTSPDPSVGKTVTAINLSISIALDQNYSTFLVDCDLRRPSVSRSLGFAVEVGFNDYLASNGTLEDVLVDSQIERLVIAPTRRVESGSSELLSSPKMKYFVQEARDYVEQIVVFDLPPVLVGDDVVALSQHLDALLLVVEDGKTQTQALARAMELLHDANVLGVVLNKGARHESQQYKYGPVNHASVEKQTFSRAIS